MARTPSKRWVEMVETYCLRLAKYGRILDGPAMLRSEAATLLSRQHKEFMELVKKVPTYDPATTVSGMQRIDKGQWVRLDAILAALQQGGKK